MRITWLVSFSGNGAQESHSFFLSPAEQVLCIKIDNDPTEDSF